MSILRDLRTVLAGRYAWLTRLLLLNALVFFVVNVIINLIILSGNVQGVDFRPVDPSDWLALPGQPEKIPAHAWTILSYMFVHADFMHLLSNMLFLFFFGRIFSEYVGNNRLVAVYLVGGLCGAIVYVLLSFALPSHSLRGASAAVMAIVVCAATVAPDIKARLFGVWAVKIKYLALAAVVLTSVYDLAVNTGGKVAHLGGAAFGLIYGMQLSKGNNFLRGFAKLFKRSPGAKMRVEHRRSVSDEDYNTDRAAKRRRVDEILDKISRSGYDSLSKDEREFLHKYGGNV